MRMNNHRIVRSSTMTGAEGGFSLIEVAVVMFIIVLLLGSIMIPLTTQVEQRQISDTQKTLDEIKEALTGFAIANGYLPCPDTNGDGVADPNAPGACANAAGAVPWATLNVPAGDAWGNRFSYRVTPEFTNTPPASGTCVINDGRIGLCDTGNITVNTRNPTTKALQILSANTVAVIFSPGKNGYGATSTAGTPRAAVPGVNTDETTNAAAGTTFISRTATSAVSTCSDTVAGQTFCEFDDIVVWLSRYTLINRMVAAGKLP